SVAEPLPAAPSPKRRGGELLSCSPSPLRGGGRGEGCWGRRSLVRVRRLPEVLALGVLLGVHGRVRLDGAVAVDLDLTGEAHLVLAADTRQHAEQGEALHERLAAEVLRALLDQHLAGPALPVTEAVDVPRQARIDDDPRPARLLAEVGAGGD